MRNRLIKCYTNENYLSNGWELFLIAQFRNILQCNVLQLYGLDIFRQILLGKQRLSFGDKTSFLNKYCLYRSVYEHRNQCLGVDCTSNNR